MIDRINQLPDGEKEFAYEIDLLGKVSGVMSEATEILARPETGSRRSPPRPRPSSCCCSRSGSTREAAGAAAPTLAAGAPARPMTRPWLFWVGGVNQKEVREDRGVSQATGESGPSCPKSSAPGSMSTSTGWNVGPAVSEPEGGREDEPAS